MRAERGAAGHGGQLGLWKSLADTQPDDQRQVTIDSGLEPMPDEIAIRALRSAIGPGAPVRSTVVAADWSRLADRLPHPGLAAHRRRPAADSTTGRARSSVRSSVESLENCRTDRRRDILIDHVGALVADAMGMARLAVPRSVGRLLPVRHGFADERDTSTLPVGQPRRRRYHRPSCSTIRPLRLSPATWPRFCPSCECRKPSDRRIRRSLRI